MNDYMGASVREAQMIQISQDAALASQRAAAAAGIVASRVDEMRDMVDQIQSKTDLTETHIIQLQLEMHQFSQELSGEIHALKNTIDDAIIPSVDNKTVELIIATLAAFTVCFVVCQFLIFCTSYQERRKSRVRVRNNDIV